MRRWHALPLAVLVAVATAGGLFSAVTPGAEAGTDPYIISIDCDSGGAIDASCTYPSGTSSITVDVVLSNVSGANPTDLAAFNFEVIANQAVLSPPAVADATGRDANPDANDAVVEVPTSWNCTLPPPSNDQDASPTVAESFISCFGGDGTSPSVATGSSIVLATITYNVPADGFSDLDFGGLSVGNLNGDAFENCPSNCVGADVTVGAVVDTPTTTPTAAATNTPAPTATACVPGQPGCATATPKTFVTITPTPGGETATPVPGGEQPTTVPGGGEQPGGGTPPGGSNPGGGAGAGGAGPIRLPDTGNDGDGGLNWSSFSLIALAALAAGSVAGGTYYYAARRITSGDRGR